MLEVFMFVGYELHSRSITVSNQRRRNMFLVTESAGRE